MEQLVRVTIRIQILLVFCVLLGLCGPGCFYRHPSGVFDRGQYSQVELPLSAEAQKARSVAVAYVDGECKKDTSEFSISVLQDSLNFAVLCRPIQTSFTDSAGKVWVSTFGGYDVIIRKVDLTITRVWVYR